MLYRHHSGSTDNHPYSRAARIAKRVLVLIVFLLALAYFLLDYNRFLGVDDEGYLLYNFDRVARGELPHKDFYDIYGALTFFVGGALFKVFGTGVLVERTFVVLMKAGMATIIFLIGIRLMPYLFAFLGSALFIVFWGDPIFPPILYGNNCAHFLSLLGVLFMAYFIENQKMRWIFAAGLCGGLAFLFKLPNGIFTLLAFALFLVFKEHWASSQRRPSGVQIPADERFIKGVRLLKFAGVAGTGLLAILYFLKFRLDASYFVIFLLPLFLALALMLAREFLLVFRIRWDAPSQGRDDPRLFIAAIALLSIGPLSLFLVQTLLYYKAGGLEEMLYDTFLLPFAINYTWPLETPRLQVALILFVSVLAVSAWFVGKNWGKSNRFVKWTFFLGVFVLLLAPFLYGMLCGIRFRVWHARVADTLATLVLALTFPFVAKTRNGDSEDTRRTLCLALVYLASSLFLIMAFPRSDEGHFIANETVVFVLAAFLLWQLTQGSNHIFDGRGLIQGGMWVAAALLPIVYPFFKSIQILFMPGFPEQYQRLLTPEEMRFYEMSFNAPRARGLKILLAKSYTTHLMRHELTGVDETVEFIRSHSAATDRIFVMSEHQIIYFLTERDTVLPKENYFVYLSNFGFANPDTIVKLTDEHLLETLIKNTPRFVIQQVNDLETSNFRMTWPKTTLHIQASYVAVKEFGRFQVLELRGRKSGAAKSQ